MPEDIRFNTFITKGMAAEKETLEKRIFTGHITSEIVDRQNEIIIQSEVLKIMDTFMAINPVISDSHSNRMVGKVLSYEKSEIEGHPSVKIRAEIYKHKDVTLYDKVWEAIVKGEYSGLSMGGASKTRTPLLKQDGGYVIKLSDLELYEIAICKTPANQLAIVDFVNTFAKDNSMPEKIQTLEDGRQIIKCSSIFCSVDSPTEVKKEGIEEAHGMNQDKDQDNNNKPMDETGKHEEIEKLVMKFTKDLVEMTKPIRGHPWDYWRNKLMRENNYSAETANAVIGSWEAHDKLEKTTIQHEYIPMEKCGICGMHKSHSLHGVVMKEETKKVLMTEGEHNTEYGQKDEAKEKEKEMTGTKRNDEDDLVKTLKVIQIKNILN